eukprot:353867_1
MSNLILWILRTVNTLVLISYFSLSANAQELDCAYVQNPQYNIQQQTQSLNGVFPLSYCRIDSNMELGIFASEFTCDEFDNVYVSIWNHTNQCNHNILPTYYIHINAATEYNCNSTNECEYVILEQYQYRVENDHDCIESTTPISRHAHISNKCNQVVLDMRTYNYSYMFLPCDPTLGIITKIFYASSGCTGRIFRTFNFSTGQFKDFGVNLRIYSVTNCEINNSNKSITTCDSPINSTMLRCGDKINLDMIRQEQYYKRYYLTVNQRTMVNIDTSQPYSQIYASIYYNNIEIGSYFHSYGASNGYGQGHNAFPMLETGIEYEIYVKEEHYWHFWHGNGSYNLHIQCFAANNKYVLITQFQTYDEAESECERQFGTTLATVLTQYDINEAMKLYNQSEYDIVSVSLWIGWYRDISNGSEWVWIDNRNDIYWDRSWNLNLTQQPDEIFISSDTHRLGTVMCVTNSVDPKFHALSANSVYYPLCNAPGYEYTYPNLRSGAFINSWRPSELYLDRGNSFAIWNRTLFIIEMNKTTEQWMIKSNRVYGFTFDIVIFNYQKNISNKTVRNYWYTQYKSSFYLLVSYVTNAIIKFELTHINLNTNVIKTFNDPPLPWQLLFDPDICLVADQSRVFVLRASVMLLYDLETEQWSQSNIWDDIPAACAIDKNDEFIYIFGLHQDVLYKYEIESGQIIILNEINICRNAIGSAITAGNGKVYLYGCYIGSWKCLIFDTDIERFEQRWVEFKDYIMDGGFTTNNKGSKLIEVDDNVIALVHGEDVSYGVYYTFIEYIAINFDNTRTTVWPSDGINLQFYISAFQDHYLSGNVVQIKCNDTKVPIDARIALNISNCYCIDHLCWGCLQHFALNKYLLLEDKYQLDSIILNLSSYQLDYGGMTPNATIANPFLYIRFKRCIIHISNIQSTYGKMDDITVHYTVNKSCYLRTNTNFLFNVSIFKFVDIQWVNISIVDNQTHICQICKFDNYCTYCQQNNFSLINQELKSEHGVIIVSFTSSMIDVVIDYDQKAHSVVFEPDSSDSTVVADIVIGSFVVLCLIVFLTPLIYCHKKNKRLKQIREQYTHYIANPMVLSICIGYYHENVDNPDINAYLTDLDALEQDYKNLKILCKKLNYDIYPKHLQLEWTQDEIIKFIEEHTQKFVANIDTLKDSTIKPNKRVNGYDGIIMILSGHGYHNSIITSDYQLVNKTSIHRLLSTNYPQVREVPRIAMYDCCDGDFKRSHQPSNYQKKITDKGKYFDVDDIIRAESIWKLDEKNPDYLLSCVHGANQGFQAKMNSIDGSYLIYEFVKKMIANIEGDNKLFLGEIIDAIQNDLHDRGKQQIEAIFNNNTRYLKFKPNNNEEVDITVDNIEKKVILTDHKSEELVPIKHSKTTYT